jgi:phage-related protein
MKKRVIIHVSAQKELSRFSNSVREDFEGLFEVIEELGQLSFPDARKITKDLFEIRIKREGEYRGVYAYLVGDIVSILHAFRKKSAKTPIASIRLSQQRLKDYE